MPPHRIRMKANALGDDVRAEAGWNVAQGCDDRLSLSLAVHDPILDRNSHEEISRKCGFRRLDFFLLSSEKLHRDEEATA